MSATDGTAFTDGAPFRKTSFTKCQAPKKEYICVETNSMEKAFCTFTKSARKVDAPVHPKYIDFDARLRSYEGYWPPHFVKRPDELARAGFFYHGYFSGVYDCVKCFYCDQGVCLWLEDDDPVAEHARFNPHCPFIRSVKEKTYFG